jgi:1,4-alpha-glucan branching enzyme
MGDAAKTFAALTYVLPGMPLIYSGQEVGLNRRLLFFEKDSISWNDRDGFTDFYRSLNKLKKSNPALMCQERGGDLIEIGNNNARNIWSFKRAKDQNEVVCVFNFSKKTQKVDFEQDFPGQGFKVFPDNAEVSSQKSMNLGPWEYRIFYK